MNRSNMLRPGIDAVDWADRPITGEPDTTLTATPDDIIHAAVDLAATESGLSLNSLMGADRRAVPSAWRAAIMWVARHHPGIPEQARSFPALGEVFGRDHSSIVRACQRVDAGNYTAEVRVIVDAFGLRVEIPEACIPARRGPKATAAPRV